MGSVHIKRSTFFKVPNDEDIEKVLAAYKVLRATAVKDDKPYIVSNAASKVINTDNPISQGYTILSQSIFKNREDHDFYDKECPAHKTLKQTTGPVQQGVMTIVTEGEWPEAKL